MKQARISTLLAVLCLAVAPAAFAGGNMSKSQPSAEEKNPTIQSSQPQSATASSEQVRDAQQQLSQRGHDPGPVDGVMGEKTRAAVKDFQQAQGMPATGQLDRQTVAALGNGSASSNPSSGSTSGSPSTSGSTTAPGASSDDAGRSATPSGTTNAPNEKSRSGGSNAAGSGAGNTK